MIFEKVPLEPDGIHIRLDRVQPHHLIYEFSDWVYNKRKDVLADMRASGLDEEHLSYIGPIWNYCVEHRPDLFAVWRLLR